ncbi:MAG: 50S ribosomal protein L25 [Anaerolineae bacterium]|nr:50S ribosomal protein L25 [Anaerolineae bacterium]
MEAIELQATPRTVIGKQVNALRREGITPGVIYGSGTDPIAVQFVSRDLEHTVSKAGSSTLVYVFVEGIPDPYTTIVRDVQYHTIRRNVQHIDLQALNLKETVRVPVALVLVGESNAVETFGGVLLQHLNEIEIECLPMALIPEIEIDISGINKLGQSITVGDIVPPPGITILTPVHELVVQVSAPEEEQEEEETLVLGGTPEAGDVEVITRTRAEENEG